MRLIRPACVALVAATFAAHAADAQRADTTGAALSAGPGILVGIVVDSVGRAIEDVEITLGGRDAGTRTGPDGVFRLTDVAEGDHDLRARRIGFGPQAARVVVGPEGGRVIIVLRAHAAVLEPIVTSAARGGLSGVISDTVLRPLEGAQVRVFGAGGQWTLTDSAGSFFLPVRGGSYMIRVSAEGHETRLLSVRVPSDSGRWVGVLLREGEPTVRERIAQEELRWRLAWRQGVMTSFFTREDLAKWGGLPLTNVVRMGAMKPFDSSCMALVNGGPERVPFWLYDADELESVEVYPGAECPAVFVWLRR